MSKISKTKFEEIKKNLKNFFQKIGSNSEIKDKTVSIHWGELWDFVASAKGGSGLPSASFASQNSPRISNFANVSLGELIVSFARTFFERKLKE